MKKKREKKEHHEKKKVKYSISLYFSYIAVYVVTVPSQSSLNQNANTWYPKTKKWKTWGPEFLVNYSTILLVEEEKESQCYH